MITYYSLLDLCLTTLLPSTLFCKLWQEGLIVFVINWILIRLYEEIAEVFFPFFQVAKSSLSTYCQGCRNIHCYNSLNSELKCIHASIQNWLDQLAFEEQFHIFQRKGKRKKKSKGKKKETPKHEAQFILNLTCIVLN